MGHATAANLTSIAQSYIKYHQIHSHHPQQQQQQQQQHQQQQHQQHQQQQQHHHHHHHLTHHQTTAGCNFKPQPPSSNRHSQPTITVVDSTAATNSNSNSKRKRSWSRAVFSQLQRKGLEIQFQIQKYITKPDRRKLAARLGLTDAQVMIFVGYIKQMRFPCRLLNFEIAFNFV